MERTLVLLKPDCVQRRLMARVLARFEDKGLRFAAMKLMRITPQLARRHYAEHVQKAWYPELETFITGGPVLAMILEGPEAIRVVRDMVGVTNGLKASLGGRGGVLAVPPCGTSTTPSNSPSPEENHGRSR